MGVTHLEIAQQGRLGARRSATYLSDEAQDGGNEYRDDRKGNEGIDQDGAGLRIAVAWPFH
ncbi:MAG: hypothetical protein MI724_09250 [Spirochaetales bacterium]|nr:hypothetical protein [Spirochaetales bacterium]